MSEILKISEHESVEWILKQISKLSKKSFLKRLDVAVTSIDINVDIFVLGTNNGNVIIINRSNNAVESILLKKDIVVNKLKLIHTVDISIAIGLNDGSVFILTIPFSDSLNYSEMNQFIVPTEHRVAISAMCWSKNSEKLFTGDINGFIFCTEINHVTKTVLAYKVYQSFSTINQLAYDHKCLIISSNAETFMWNINLNKKIQIGNKNRNEQNKFGISVVNKLCKSEEMEVISVRPNGKLWISDNNGTVKKSIILKADSVFASDKFISLLPCVTSQSKSSFLDDIVSGKTKFHLGLIIPINENEILFWSEDSVVILDICTGNILSSSYNLGKIQNISICNLSKMPISDLNISNIKNTNKLLYEIWILRQPTCENDNKLVRLSFIPLITTRLQIDPFYFYSQAKISAINDNNQVNNSKEVNIIKIVDTNDTLHDTTEVVSDNEKIQTSNLENWLSKIGVTKQRIDIVETFNDMRSNMLEFTNKTKEVFKQGQAILNDESEIAVEQANELTEEGVVIDFNESNLSTDNIKIDLDPLLEVQSNIIINSSCSRLRKENRKIEIVNFEESCDLTDKKNEDSETYQEKIMPLTIFEEKVFSTLYKTKDSENCVDNSYENLELYLDIIGRPLEIKSTLEVVPESNSFDSSDEDVASDELLLNLKECKESNDIQEHDEINKNYNCDYCNVSSPISATDISDMISTQSTESYDVLMSSNSFLDKEDKFSKDVDSNLNVENNPILGEIDNDLSNTIKCPLSEVMDSPKFLNERKMTPNSNEETEDVEQNQISLSNSILLQCNKWISHRGPILAANVKLFSMTVNRRMIWMTDTKSVLHVGFKNVELNDDKDNLSSTEKIIWLQDLNLRTDKLASSPNGFILWREKGGEVSVYTGVTKILTPKVVKDKVLLKQYWEVTMQEIKEIDIDEEMAVIVTKKGQLKVINGISSRTPYKQCKSVNITGHVTLATTFNGLIWCVTELDVANTSKLSQHVFACQAKDEEGKFNSTYWRTVPLLKDLVKYEEQAFGGLGGSELIKSIHLGNTNLAWILTIDNMCFYCQNVSSENPIGDGIWFQISLQFLYQTPSSFEESMSALSSGIQNKVEKMFGYAEGDGKSRRVNPLNCNSSILISVKSLPKRAEGNGLLWITSTERNSPCILFESDKNILGHHWIDCFPIHQNPINRLPGLPALTSWAAIEFSSKNTLWLLHKSGELFCFVNEKNMRTVAIPSLYGKVVKISARNSILVILTTRSKVFIRMGIMDNNPYGSDWREVKRGWSKNEKIKNISCSDNEIWLIFENRVFYNENLKALIFNTSKKLPWNELIFKIKDSNAKKISAIQFFKSSSKNYIWVITEPFGYIYFSIWEPFVNSFLWSYILGPSAESIHVSNQNVWMVEQFTGNLFVRCGVDLENRPIGDYWINVPLITKPVIDMAVLLDNQVFVIDFHNRLLKHSWAIVEGNVSQSKSESTTEFSKPDDYDWELLC